jgi:hypothetical protein
MHAGHQEPGIMRLLLGFLYYSAHRVSKVCEDRQTCYFEVLELKRIRFQISALNINLRAK